MDGLKQIMYGVTDFALMRTENAYFVDRTGFIRELEKARYALFLRPRRFGKSLWCSVFQCSYDVDYASRSTRRRSTRRCAGGTTTTASRPRRARTALVLYYMQYFLQNRKPQPELVDENLRTDYMKIRHIITEGRRVNGNYHRLEDIIVRLGTTATLRKSFQAKELGIADNIVSFLFYNGLVTVTGEDFGQSSLGIPNLTVGEFMHDCVPKAYQDVHGVDPQILDIANGMTDFACRGRPDRALRGGPLARPCVEPTRAGRHGRPAPDHRGLPRR